MKQDEKTRSYHKVIWITLSVTIGLLWWHGFKNLPSKPQQYHLPHQEAKKIVMQVLARFDLKSPIVRMGHYPLLGGEFNQQAIFPLLHTPCPISQGCNQVISDLKVALLQKGYQLLESVELPNKDRPFYYAIAKNKQPVMALRMMPVLSYSTLVLSVDQSNYLDIQTLLQMNAHLSFVIDQKTTQGRKLYDHLSLAGRELYLKLDLSSLSPSSPSTVSSSPTEVQPTVALQKILREVDEIVQTHLHFRGIWISETQVSSMNKTDLSHLMQFLNRHRLILLTQQSSQISLLNSLAQVYEVRSLMLTYNMQSQRLKQELLNLDGTLLMDGVAHAYISLEQQKDYKILNHWLQKLDQSAIKLFRVSEISL